MPKRANKSNNSTRQMADQIKSLRGDLRAKARISTPRKSSKPRQSGPAAISTKAGSLIVSDREYMVSVHGSGALPNIGIGSASFWPGASTLARLDQYAGMFDQFRVLALSFEYRPAVGTTVGGMVHMGFDFDDATLPQTKAGVAALNPVASGTAYSPKRFTVDSTRAMKARWQFTYHSNSAHLDLGSCGALMWATAGVAGLEAGEIWCSYKVEFQGPVAPGQVTRDASLLAVSLGDWDGTSQALTSINNYDSHGLYGIGTTFASGTLQTNYPNLVDTNLLQGSSITNDSIYTRISAGTAPTDPLYNIKGNAKGLTPGQVYLVRTLELNDTHVSAAVSDSLFITKGEALQSGAIDGSLSEMWTLNANIGAAAGVSFWVIPDKNGFLEWAYQVYQKTGSHTDNAKLHSIVFIAAVGAVKAAKALIAHGGPFHGP